jgi:TPR repeat protein
MRLCFGLFLLLLFGCKHIPVSVDEDVMALAEQGDAASQMKVALAFDKEDDFPEAAFWYQKAAEQGVSEAQNNLGVMYKDGQGIRQDFGEAARWFLLAARQDNTLAQLNLGWLYHAGKGLRQDADSASYWYMRAAQKGHATAQLNIGILCLQQNDTVTAIHWLKQASQQGNSGAQRILQHLDRNK